MSLIENTHHDHPHPHQKPPVWVRFYDPIVQFVTLGKTQKMHQGTLTLARLRSGDKVLDIGCGTGNLTLAAEKMVGVGGTVVGLDVEPAMIHQARQKAAKTNSPVLFEVASITAIPYPDAAFDVILSTAMFHHLNPTQQVEGLAELYRVLKGDGRLLIVDLNTARRSLVASLPGHKHLARQDTVLSELPGLLQRTGFQKVQTGHHPFKSLSYALAEKK